VLEAVVNVSVGEPCPALDAVVDAAGSSLLDVHSDAWHGRSVLTLADPDPARVEASARAVARAAVATIDIARHDGVHPRMGAVDVVPFVPVAPPGQSGGGGIAHLDLTGALAARDAFAEYVGEGLGIPCFVYGPERTLPQVRQAAFAGLAPDTGPAAPHPTAGATCVGARAPLVAYNIWLESADLALARRVAASLRSPVVRSLGFAVGNQVQVSCNLVAPHVVGPGAVYDAVRALAPVARAELVGLLPAAVLAAEPPGRWDELNLAETKTLEWRLEQRQR
jgi:glutamate formiminotransferase/glutamate formiminotransferase/formiminotetrahydrofolate cyclodeaminase